MSRPELLTYRGCRCGRVVVAPATPGIGRDGMWCPNPEAGIHDYLIAYPF